MKEKYTVQYFGVRLKSDIPNAWNSESFDTYGEAKGLYLFLEDLGYQAVIINNFGVELEK